MADVNFQSIVTQLQQGVIALNAIATNIKLAFPNTLTSSVVYDPPNLASGAQTTTTVTVSGAALGKQATASFSLSLQGMIMTAYVSAADTVTVVIYNNTGGAINLASGILSARV